MPLLSLINHVKGTNNPWCVVLQQPSKSCHKELLRNNYLMRRAMDYFSP